MIRLLIALIIVALLLTKVSSMFDQDERNAEASAPEDTIVGSAYEPYTRAQQFSEDFPDELDQKREELDKKIDGG